MGSPTSASRRSASSAVEQRARRWIWISPGDARIVVAGIGVLGVHRRDELIQVGLGHAGDAIKSRANHLHGQQLQEPGHGCIDEHRLEFARGGQAA